MRDYNKLFKDGNAAQLRKLLLYSRKPNWEKMSFDKIKQGIFEEFKEVENELIKKEVDCELLKDELADLANNCHFGIQYCNKILDSEKEIAKRDRQIEMF